MKIYEATTIYNLIGEIDNYRVESPEELYRKALLSSFNPDQEEFYVVVLVNNNMVSVKRLFIGGMTSSVVDLKTLLKHVLMERGNAFAIAHNHPSTNLVPSREDQAVTEQVKQAAQLLGLSMLDSILFSDVGYVSIMHNESGLNSSDS